MARQQVTTLAGGRAPVPIITQQRAAVPTSGALRMSVALLLVARLSVTAEALTRLIVTTLIEPSGIAPTPPPVNTTPPSASGLMRIGQTLTSTDGVWTDAASYARQWTRDAVPIVGETASTYVVVAADISALISCEITATGPGGVSSPVSSNTLASVWRDILVARPATLIFDGLDPYCHGGAAIGAPVASLYAVNGPLLGSQSLTAARATRSATGLTFDGVDDRYVCTSTLAGYFSLNTTYCICADAVSGNTGKYFFQARATSNTLLTRNARVAKSASTSRNDHRTNTAGSLLVGPAVINPSIAVVWAPADSTMYDLAAGVSAFATATPALVSQPIDEMTLGSLVVTTTTWEGNLRAYAADGNKWTVGDLAIWRACAIAAGAI